MGLKKILATLLLLTAVGIAGCGKEDIFEGFDQVVDETTTVKDAGMLPDVLYVKDGTSFVPIVSDGGQAAQVPNAETDYIVSDRAAMAALPVLYKGETLCVRSGDATMAQPLQLTRYRDAGPTIGVSGLKYEPTLGYYTTSTAKLATGSSAEAEITPRILQTNFGIREVNGSMPAVSISGTVMGLEAGQAAVLDLFVGTEHATLPVVADRYLYQSSETFQASQYVLSARGYIAYTLPEGLMDGYYRAGNYGVFRYEARTKAEGGDADENMNVPNDFPGITRGIDDVIMATTIEKTVYVKERGAELEIMPLPDMNAKVDRVTVTDSTGETTTYEAEDTRIRAEQEGRYTITMSGINLTESMLVIHTDYTAGDESNETDSADDSTAAESDKTDEESEDVPAPDDKEPGEESNEDHVTPTPTETPTPSPTPTEEPPTETPMPTALPTPTPTDTLVEETYEVEVIEYVDENGNIQVRENRR